MWCEQCQTDVATEISGDGQSLLCTTCGQQVQAVVAPSLHPETQSAREFLERWAREQQALKARAEDSAEKKSAADEPPSSPTPSKPAKTAESSPTPAAETPPMVPPESKIRSKMKWRVDGEHSAPSGPTPSRRDRQRRPHLEKAPAEPVAADPAPIAEATPPAAPQKRRRIDENHALAAGPHFDARVNAPRKTIFPGRSEAIWGQLLAYSGVGLLTVGTVLVLWGYFGDLEQYASTGWLVSTAGQMLLLLGIVTLVSGGMQQTTHEVSQRIEHLGGKIIRIEESTDKILKGPHFRRSRRRAGRSAKAAGDEQSAA